MYKMNPGKCNSHSNNFPRNDVMVVVVGRERRKKPQAESDCSWHAKRAGGFPWC